ncbi:DoxX family protein [Nocardioides sp.]|uniref:DoxX family protein n=1 Tax=Nocardioides sp. TaxID=35761 RepID=UPI0026A12F20
MPAAAISLAVLMVGAALIHLRDNEYPAIAVNLVLLALALFVAFERIGPEAL